MTIASISAPTHSVDPQDISRADFYGLLGRLFYAAPDAALLRALADSGELAADAAGAALPAAWNSLRRAARDTTAEAVKIEYDETFIGVGKPEVMLYGSFYLAGFLNEKPLAELRRELAELGFARQKGANESEDHISGLVDVMRQLIVDEDSAPSERDAAQRQFFARHLEPWYDRLCKAIEMAPGTDFYKSVGGFTRAFLDLESEFFRMD